MAPKRKVIITCAVTAAIPTPSMLPHLPVTPEESADAAVGAAEAGTAIVHLHARDPKTSQPDQSPERFSQLLAYGVAYADGVRFEKGVFRGRRAIAFLASGGTEARFGQGAVYGQLEHQVLWQVQHLTLRYLGYTVEPPFVAYGTPQVGDRIRAVYLEDLAARAVTGRPAAADAVAGIAGGRAASFRPAERGGRGPPAAAGEAG